MTLQIQLDITQTQARALVTSLSPDQCLCLTWQLDRVDGVDQGKPLAALLNLTENGLFVAMTEQTDVLVRFCRESAEQIDSATLFSNACQQLALQTINCHGLLPLQHNEVLKPWGRECWFTGIEERGVAKVNGIPLHWLTSLLPQLGLSETPSVLLKILQPHSHPILGNLYLESHRQKAEVYVVSNVDQECWPHGKAELLAGFSIQKRAEFPDHESFLQACKQAIRQFEVTRRALEPLETDELDLNSRKQARNQLAEDLLDQEAAAYQAMRQFFEVHDIQQGDVIVLEPGLIHSLQHGIEVIEFQTPQYERLVVAFQQQVMTQDQWDTSEALQLAEADASPRITCLDGSEVRHDLAELPGFSLSCLSIDVAGEAELAACDGARILMALTDGLKANDEIVGLKQPLLVPPGLDLTISNRGDQAVHLLIATCEST